MAAIGFRLLLIAFGLGLGQIGLDSFARGEPIAVVQLALSILALVAGSAGFVVPLLQGGIREEVHHG
jgi:hypothetical protein